MDVDLLARIAGDYDLRIDRASLRAALGDQDFAEWARTHLHPDNLLTVDEFVLYTALDHSGIVDSLVAGQDLDTVQGLDEQDLRDAIAELERSTATITEHAETLGKERAVVGKLLEHRTRVSAQRAELGDRRRGGKAAEVRRIQAEVDEAGRMMGFRISDLEQQAKAARGIIHQALDGVLQDHDKLLASLQKLGWELEPDDPEEQEAAKNLREVCMKLIKTSVETIRAKLDRVYLEALHAAQVSGSQDNSGSGSAPPDQGDVQATKEEVESLYAEILPVAQMAVEQEHLEPALKSVSLENTCKLGRSAAAVAYIQQCLDYLVDQTSRLHARTTTAQAHDAACAAVLAAARTELSAPPIGAVIAGAAKHGPKSSTFTNPDASPVRARAGTVAATGVTSGPRPRQRQRGLSLSGAAPDDDAAATDPLAALVRGLALTLPTTTLYDQTTAGSTAATAATDTTSPTAGYPRQQPPRVIVDARPAIALLSRALAERRQKADEISQSAQRALVQTVATRLADGRGAVQALRDSVLAETTHGPPARGLVDPGIEASLVVLAEEVRRINDAVEAAEREMDGAAVGGSAKRDEFVRMWADGK